MKKKLLLASLFCCGLIYLLVINPFQSDDKKTSKIERKIINPTKKGKKKTLEERALYNEARSLYEFYRRANPNTGDIPKTEKNREFKQAKNAQLRVSNNLTAKVPQAAYVSRGPGNLGGRTRALVVDRSDNTGNTIIAGGVSGGVFRTTDGGANWTKVSPNDEIHSVTAIVQDPRSGFENIWYYGTGEALGNSANASSQGDIGAFFYGDGIWQSTNGGITWSQISSTDSAHEGGFNSRFDIITNLAVHPVTGELFAAILGRIVRFNGTSWVTELNSSINNTNDITDLTITSAGRVYAAFSGECDDALEGVWSSATGNSSTGTWSRINTSDFTPAGRVVLALAPSDEDLLYVLFVNGNTSDCSNDTQEADLWRWDQGTTTFTNYSAVLPSEGCDMDGSPSNRGNNPLSVQGGYDLVVSVKPDNANFVVIGGTNVYKKENITNSGSRFIRIGGYASNTTYAAYSNHHPDIHALVFSPFNSNVLFSGTDGGVHRTNDITASTMAWSSLNKNYQTFQFYHVGISPAVGSDFVIGGTQDNGTVIGGTDVGEANLTDQTSRAGGDGGAAAISIDPTCNLTYFLSLQNGTMYRFCDGFTEITPESAPDTPYDSQFITYYHLDPDNNNAIYYASTDNLLISTDASNVTKDGWTDLGDTTTAFGHSDHFEIFATTRGAYNAASSYLLMGGDHGHIYRLNDPQNATNLSSAVNITPLTASTSFPSIVSGLAIHPSNPDIVLVTYSNYGINSIYLTTNATAATPTWTLVESNLSSHSIRSAAITEVNNQTLYFVGTARGLYSSTDPTVTSSDAWVREAPSQIGFAVVSSLAYRPSDNHLLIGTHGNGMYEATVSNVLSTNDVNNVSNEISLYPNPASTTINLEVPTSKNNLKYALINVSGQVVSKGTLYNNQIDVSSLTSGIYFIQLDIDGELGLKKFVKK